MARIVALVVALALAGCAIPPPAGLSVPSYSPVREALSYFPSSAPVVVVTKTDPQDPGLRRAAASGALAPLRRVAARQGLFYEQWGSLLGGPAVLGLPRVGGAPLAVLATDDPDRLRVFADARVAGDHATPAGEYRGTDLFAEDGLAFGVRDRVLVVSGSTRDLIAALDVRADDEAFEASVLNDAQPEAPPPATFARAYLDLDQLAGRADAQLRRLPVLAALTDAGVSVGATAEALHAAARADLEGVDLTSDDLPELEGGRAALPRTGPALAVADLAPLARAAERALRTARPITALRVDALRAAGLPLDPALLSGPAVLTPAPAIRLEPLRPQPLRTALRRLRQKPRDGFRLVAGVRIGFVGDTLVAGRASARALRHLARARLTPTSSALAVRLTRPRPLVITLSGSPDHLTAHATAGF